MGKLTEEIIFQKIQEKFKKLNGWSYKNRSLEKEFNFNNYSEAVLFTNVLAYIAQNLDHHPDILLKYNFVSIRLSTHDIGDISLKDIKFAEKIDKLTKNQA